MLKTIETLVSAFSSKKKGNHRVVFKGWERHFYYYFTEICTVNDVYKTFKTNDGGWGTQSTTRAINDYRKYFKSCGYIDLNESEDKLCC